MLRIVALKKESKHLVFHKYKSKLYIKELLSNDELGL